MLSVTNMQVSAELKQNVAAVVKTVFNVHSVFLISSLVLQQKRYLQCSALACCSMCAQGAVIYVGLVHFLAVWPKIFTNRALVLFVYIFSFVIVVWVFRLYLDCSLIWFKVGFLYQSRSSLKWSIMCAAGHHTLLYLYPYHSQWSTRNFPFGGLLPRESGDRSPLAGSSSEAPVRGLCPPESEAVCRHCLQILTAETVKIWKFRTIRRLILDQHVSPWG